MGLFDDIVKIQGEVKSVESSLQAAANDPVVIAVKEGIKLLPEGGLKKWVSMDAKTFWKNVFSWFTGKKFTRGQYTLGERYLDQLEDNGNPNAANSYSEIPDSLVPTAQMLFSILFGVRIDTVEDLDALNVSPAAYYARGNRDDIPLEAVERAVWLKKNKFPDSYYNNRKWDVTEFEKRPLVAPIPDIKYGALYTGELPGGAFATNGVIEGDSVLKQALDNAVVDEEGNIVDVDPIPTTTEPNRAWVKWALGLTAAILLYQSLKPKHGR
jgi:hypothetical protein